MYCPKCKCEFRSGFTRCASCNVELVHDLSEAAEKPKAASPTTPAPRTRMAEFCGFFSLQEARDAREKLRAEEIRSEVVIRDPLNAPVDDSGDEEYWLRVEVAGFSRATALLGFDAAEDDTPGSSGEGESFKCSECGARVAASESFCAECGARFEDD